MNTDNKYSTVAEPENAENIWLNYFSAFRNCSIEVRGRILKNSQLKKFNRGDNIIKSGDQVGGIYCIQSGIVKVSRIVDIDKEFILWIAEMGDMLGLNSLIDDEPFSFFATALDQVTAYFIPASELKIILENEPVVTVQLMKNICDKLNSIDERLTSISRKKIREHCAEMLISISTISHSENDNNRYINYSIKDLAAIIGTSKSYLYKVLLEFSNKNILSVNNRKMFIKNMSALSSIALGKDKLTKTGLL